MALTLKDLEQIQPPTKLEDLGVSPGLVEDLFMRRLCSLRHSSIGAIGDALGISQLAANEVAESLRDKKLLMYQGADGRDYRITPSELGTNLTSDRMKLGMHVGQVPVPIKQYQTLVELQAAELTTNRDAIRGAFAEMVVEDSIVDQIGPALIDEGAILLYGPPGTGKTSISERLIDVFDDVVAIPRYVVADEQIISVFDPAVHHPIEDQPENIDRRFVICRRPIIVSGGELELSSLELRFDAVSGVSQAPIQMMANNGILVIDDFGRQAFTPDQLLNRWILPLAQGVDYLRSNNGGKVTIPFEVKLVFSTNIEPTALGDDAFLRRLRSKIFVGACTRKSFDWIIEQNAQRLGITLNHNSKDWIASICQSYLGELRPYIAVDFCQIAKNIAKYDHREPILSEHLIQRVADLYFVKTPDGDLSTQLPDSVATRQAAPQPEPSLAAATAERRRPV